MKFTPTALLLTLTVAACSREPGLSSNLHDTKFSRIGDAPRHCVLDGQTGLYWEVKSAAAGLHNWHNTYTWFDRQESNDELDYRGTEDGGQCEGSPCDTWNYVQAVNEFGYCGFFDWRMPSRDELFSISDARRRANPPTMNIDYFTHAQAAEYWSANDYSFQYDAAWCWDFESGLDRVDWKAAPKFVRLVRGKPSELTPVKE